MTFRWLTQAQLRSVPGELGAPVALRGGSLYRGRVAYRSPLGCQDTTTIGAVRQAILGIARTPQFPVDMQIYTSQDSLPRDWPIDKKTSTAGLQAGECLLFWEGRASTDQVVDDSLFANAPLPPLVGMFGLSIRSVDLWQQPAAGGVPGIPQPPCQPGQVFDPTQNRCVAAARPACPTGTTWNQDFGVCVPQPRACGPGQTWWSYDAFVDQPGGGGKCVPANCGPGTERNPNTGDCVVAGQVDPDICPEGFDFDPATELCIEREGEPPPTPPEPQPPAQPPGAVAAAPKTSTTAFVIGGLALAAVALAALAGRPGA